jgi:hypothetical protein
MPRVSNAVRTPLAAALLLLAATALAASPATSAAKHPNFSGVWGMDTTKFHNVDPRLKDLVFRVVQKPDTLHVTTETSDEGHLSTFDATYRLDGGPRENPLPDGSGTSTATLAWESDTLVLGTLFDVQGHEYRMTQRWSLDAARKTLNEERTAETAGRKMSMHFVFTKRK